MDSTNQTEGRDAPAYEAPKVSDYGTLLELTRVGGSVAPKDIPHGHPNSAYPNS